MTQQSAKPLTVRNRPVPAGKDLTGSQRIFFTVVLGILTAIGPFTIDMYLSALPTIERELNVSESVAQMTLTGTLIGMLVGQLVVGPLSDALGRRKPLLFGLAVHILCSALVVVTNSIELLTILRVGQGFGAAAASIISMAVVRDLFQGVAAARMLSRLMLILGVSPIFAPTIGAWVISASHWQVVFLALAVVSLIVIVVAGFLLPETLPVERRRPAKHREIVGILKKLARDRVYVGIVLMVSCTFAGLFAYISSSPFLLQNVYGLDQAQFGYAFSGVAVGMIIMTQMNVPLLRIFSPGQLLIAGLATGALSGAAMIVLASTGLGGVWGVLIPLFFCMSGMALTFPNAPAIALSRHGDSAGTASAFLGAAQNLAGAIAAPVMGLLGSGAVPMSTSICVAFTLALAMILFVVRPQGLVLSE
ncbi:multidrug effflux MFS transporter [Micrococcales bacterium 31B]|nr:multidrug effflux MFS transporter [Micrococcales bacterium 31B]